MAIEHGWADNQGVRLHYIDSRPQQGEQMIPLVLIPGALGSAEVYQAMMSDLEPRRCLAMSLRGRGQSSAPPAGYSFQDHVSDVETVIDACGLDRFCMLAYSAAVPFAVRYASRHPRRLAGLILCDYPARYPAISLEWVEDVLPHCEDRAHVIRGLQQESAEVLLWDELPEVPCPVLVLRGGQPGALLRPEAAEMYRRHLRDVQIIVFSESGHNLGEPDPEAFIETIREFLQHVDQAQQ